MREKEARSVVGELSTLKDGCAVQDQGRISNRWLIRPISDPAMKIMCRIKRRRRTIDVIDGRHAKRDRQIRIRGQRSCIDLIGPDAAHGETVGRRRPAIELRRQYKDQGVEQRPSGFEEVYRRDCNTWRTGIKGLAGLKLDHHSEHSPTFVGGILSAAPTGLTLGNRYAAPT